MDSKQEHDWELRYQAFKMECDESKHEDKDMAAAVADEISVAGDTGGSSSWWRADRDDDWQEDEEDSWGDWRGHLGRGRAWWGDEDWNLANCEDIAMHEAETNPSPDDAAVQDYLVRAERIKNELIEDKENAMEVARLEGRSYEISSDEEVEQATAPLPLREEALGPVT